MTQTQSQTSKQIRAQFRGILLSGAFCMMGILVAALYLEYTVNLSGEGVVLGLPLLAILCYAIYYLRRLHFADQAAA